MDPEGDEDEEEEAQLTQDREEEDQDEDEVDDIEQQIVNITSKNGEAEENNEAILVINNQNQIDQKDRPQTQ